MNRHMRRIVLELSRNVNWELRDTVTFDRQKIKLKGNDGNFS
jgi:hypothetical protein